MRSLLFGLSYFPNPAVTLLNAFMREARAHAVSYTSHRDSNKADGSYVLNDVQSWPVCIVLCRPTALLILVTGPSVYPYFLADQRVPKFFQTFLPKARKTKKCVYQFMC